MHNKIQGVLRAVASDRNDVDNIFTILNPWNRLMCEGRLDLAIVALQRKISLLKGDRRQSLQLSLHAIALARLLQQAGWMDQAGQWLARVRRDNLPATATQFLSLIEWKLRLSAQGSNWNSRADLLTQAQRDVAELAPAFIWRRALALYSLSRPFAAADELKRYQDHASAESDAHKSSVGYFIDAQVCLLSRDLNRAIATASSLADIEMTMVDDAGNEPTSSISALIGAEILRCIILMSGSAAVEREALRLLRELIAQGSEFGIGRNADTLSDIALNWPIQSARQPQPTRRTHPRRLWLQKPTLAEQFSRLRTAHRRLDDLQSSARL